jgi:hypothetical protein
VGNLNGHPGAVACIRIATACTAVRKIDKDFDSLCDDLVRLLSVHVHDEANSAGIVLRSWIIQREVAE